MEIHCMKLGQLETNCYIVHSGIGKAAIIDPAENADLILECLTSRSLTAEAILLTHGHSDHISAADELREKTGAEIFCGASELHLLKDPMLNMSAEQGTVLDNVTAVCSGGKVLAGGITFTLIETPGHTSGSVCWLAENHLFSGDTLFRKTAGRTDLPTGNFEAMMNSLSKLKQLLPETIAHPGHGPSTTIGAERTENRFMRKI